MAYDRLREWIEQYVDRENDSLEQIHRPMEIFWGKNTGPVRPYRYACRGEGMKLGLDIRLNSE